MYTVMVSGDWSLKFYGDGSVGFAATSLFIPSWSHAEDYTNSRREEITVVWNVPRKHCANSHLLLSFLTWVRFLTTYVNHSKGTCKIPAFLTILVH